MNIHGNTSIGGFLPDVKINKITLDASSGEIYQRFPHIEHPSESGADFKSTSNNLVVEVNMYIRDHASHNSFGTWFSNIQFEKYIMVNLIQVFNPNNGLTGFQTAVQAQQTFNGLSKADKYRRLFGTDASDGVGNGLIIQALLQGTLASGMLGDSNSEVTWRTFDIFNHPSNPGTSSPDDKIKIPYTVVDSGGSLYYDVCFRETFILPTDSPQNLYYMGFTSIDTDQLKEDFGLPDTGEAYEFLDLMGDICFGTVYQNGSVKKTSKFFLTPAGELYTGPKHYHPSQGYMAGAVHKPGGNDSEHFPLTVVKTENSKIADNRQINRYDDYIADLFYNFKKQIDIPTNIKMNSQNFLDIDGGAYSSDPHMTFDSFGNPRFAFSINMLQIARERFLYGGLLRTTPASGQVQDIVASLIFSKTYIIGMELYRQRVDGGSTDEDRPEELIAELYPPPAGPNGDVDPRPSMMKCSLEQMIAVAASDSLPAPQRNLISRQIHHIIRNGKVPTKTYAFNNGIMRSQATIKDISSDLLLNNTEKKIRTFSVTDLTAKGNPGACYKYRVKMTIKDGSIPFLTFYIASGIENLQGMVKYLSFANIPGNYDPAKKQFTQKAINEYQHKSNTQISNAMTSLKALLEIAKAVDTSNTFPLQDTKTLLNDLRPHVIMGSGSPDGISLFIKIYEKILNKIIKMAGLKNVSLEGTAHRDKSFRSNGSMKQIVELSIPFKYNHLGAPAMVKVPEKGVDNLAFDFFQQNCNFEGALNSPLEGIHPNPTWNTNVQNDISKINKFIKINANEFEDMRIQEVGRYYSSDTNQPRIFNCGAHPGGAGKTTIDFNPYSPPSMSNMYITPYAIKSYIPSHNTEDGIRRPIYTSNLTGVNAVNQKLILEIMLLIMIGKKLNLNVLTAAESLIHKPIPDYNRHLRKAKKYLLLRIATSMGIFSSQAVLNEMASDMQDFSALSPDNDQGLSQDALDQLGFDEHIQNGNDSYGMDLNEDLNHITQNILSYIIYEKVLFPENAFNKRLVSFNSTAPDNQFAKKTAQLELTNPPGNGVLNAQQHFVYSLPPQIQYLFMRDTKTEEGGNAFGQTMDSIKDIYRNSSAPSPFEGESLDYNNIPLFALLNTNIQKLYYVRGYEVNTATNVIDMKKPDVVGLGPEAMVNYNNAGKTLMCYMKKYEDPLYTINIEDLLGTSIINSCFMIDVPATPGQAAGSQVNEEPKQDIVYVQPFVEGQIFHVGSDEELETVTEDPATTTSDITLGGYS